jgi:hypothetical protein
MPFNDEAKKREEFIALINEMKYKDDIFREDYLKDTLKRNDNNSEYLLIKDVHNLGFYPSALKSIKDYKGVIITRSTKRILDSFLSTFGSKRKYLKSEFALIKNCYKKNISTGNIHIDKSLEQLPAKAKDYLKKPSFLQPQTKNQILCTHIFKSSLIYWGRNDKNLMVISHEELCKDTLSVINKVYSHLDISLGQQARVELKLKTRGKETGNFDTNKNSLQILNREYRVLDDEILRMFNELEI